MVTVKVSAVEVPENALAIGAPESPKNYKASVGVHDFLVGPGQTVTAGDGTEAEFVAVRSAW